MSDDDKPPRPGTARMALAEIHDERLTAAILRNWARRRKITVMSYESLGRGERRPVYDLETIWAHYNVWAPRRDERDKSHRVSE